MERILRLMRPSKDEVLIKESGMHAVKTYYRGYSKCIGKFTSTQLVVVEEVLLNNCLKRAKQLYNEGYDLSCIHMILFHFLKRQLRLNNMLNSMKR